MSLAGQKSAYGKLGALSSDLNRAFDDHIELSLQMCIRDRPWNGCFENLGDQSVFIGYFYGVRRGRKTVLPFFPCFQNKHGRPAHWG